MKVIKLIIACCVFMPFIAQSQSKLKTSVFGSGGNVTANGGNRIVGTIGQALIGVGNQVKSGFWAQTVDLITEVEQIPGEAIPKEFRLQQNYPNPFNPTTTIEFSVPQRAQVSLKLYDLLGREVDTLVDKELTPGEYKVVFEARGLPSGLYFYRIQAPGFVQTRKLTLLK